MKTHLRQLTSRHPARSAAIAAAVLAAAAITWLDLHPASPATGGNPAAQAYGYSDTARPNHRDVRATVFWVGEAADGDNAYIDNKSSAWADDWVSLYGGVDSPDKRCGLAPCGFTPRENPFYFALPFDDYKADGTLKPAGELRRIPWYYGGSPPLPGQSLIKNQWIAVTVGGKTAYVQWEDVGPFNEDDIDYVFGDKPPRARAGLDVSPATATYLGMDGEGRAAWHFVEPSQVPDGPWKTTVTTSGLRFH